jgi:hypothetical protein
MGDRGSTHLDRIAATALGVALGAALLGLVGCWSGNTALGASAGAVLGGLLARGAVVGTISPATTCAVLFGLVACVMGTAVDDYGGHATVPGAIYGALVGWLLWRSPRRVKPVDDLS